MIHLRLKNFYNKTYCLCQYVYDRRPQTYMRYVRLHLSFMSLVPVRYCIYSLILRNKL